ncbi:hypothetical protein SAMD00023353_3400510 [Rosellinia necatrix]|uniref:AT hook domain-containing protein n=1 Tax=Rosellinia necatrix TaxID=77044 RepID=A0A1W2TL11_ROSNE|nr:hypothetical protein SAMD00023353_3400510 [Rosellinia necatrix]
MAPRRVIADSEDEDEGDEVLLIHPGGELDRPEPDRPEPEPLSPHGQRSGAVAPEALEAPEARGQPFDATDPSFVPTCDAEKGLAVHQSHLIETIVRQSQRASAASSGDVSLPAKGKGRRANPSSGTDLTSPTAPSRRRNHTTLLSDDPSDFTTPRNSTGQEWEIPSSPEDAIAPRSSKYPRSRDKTNSGSREGGPGPVSTPIVAEMPVTEETARTIQLQNSGSVDQLDPLLPDMTRFYVAQSNLTTMQKLEYQKVNVSTNSYGGIQGSLLNQKSSGVATIPYSTPSGYSSIPPLPWEEPSVQPPSPQGDGIINISSSLDAVASGFDLPNQKSVAAQPGTETPASNKNGESPARSPSRTSSNKRKKRPAEDAEEDELSRDDIWDPDDMDAPCDSHKPRATKRRSVKAAGLLSTGKGKGATADVSSEVAIQMPNRPESPTPSLPDEAPPEPQTENLPKKRGRKKKLPVSEGPHLEVETNEHLRPNEDSTSSHRGTEMEPSLAKPKKKRGRPRKLGPSKAAQEPFPELLVDHEISGTAPPQKNPNTGMSAAIIRRQRDSEQNIRREKSEATEEVEDTESNDMTSPLKEVHDNLTTPSKPTPIGESPTKARAELNDEALTPKKQPRETPKLPPSQSKVTYRVGLSKRSRIAPLLKSIRK